MVRSLPDAGERAAPGQGRHADRRISETVSNLTAATSNLFDLIQNRSIALYSDAAMRLAISRAIIVESSRGWRLDK